MGFLDNAPADLRKRILSHRNAWGAWANVIFVETATSPQVRIARTANDGYWSYLGADVNARDAQSAGTVYPGPVAPSGIWPNGKAYFFKGSQYVRPDTKTDKVDAGYPAPIAGNRPELFTSYLGA